MDWPHDAGSGSIFIYLNSHILKSSENSVGKIHNYVDYKYDGWKFNSGNYLLVFTTDTK